MCARLNFTGNPCHRLTRRSLVPAGAAPPLRARISFGIVQCRARRRVFAIAYRIRAIAVLLPCSTPRRVCSAISLPFCPAFHAVPSPVVSAFYAPGFVRVVGPSMFLSFFRYAWCPTNFIVLFSS